jgi:hypothetical protein
MKFNEPRIGEEESLGIPAQFSAHLFPAFAYRRDPEVFLWDRIAREAFLKLSTFWPRRLAIRFTI